MRTDDQDEANSRFSQFCRTLSLFMCTLRYLSVQKYIQVHTGIDLVMDVCHPAKRL